MHIHFRYCKDFGSWCQYTSNCEQTRHLGGTMTQKAKLTKNYPSKSSGERNNEKNKKVGQTAW